MNIISTPSLSGLFFNATDRSCIDNPFIDLNNFCIIGVTYDEFIMPQQCTSKTVGDWGVELDMIDGVLDNSLPYYFNPLSVDIFIIDTGIRITHDEFWWIETLQTVPDLPFIVQTPDYWDDDNYVGYDHGTSVASAAGGFNVGASRFQKIYNFNCGAKNVVNGVRTITITRSCQSIALSMIANRLADGTSRNAVINLSFGRPESVFSSDIVFRETILRNLNFLGAIVVGAAGESGGFDCNYPAFSQWVIGVAGHTRDFNARSDATFGACVDVWAPGAAVLAGVTGDSSYIYPEGSSIATAFVSGVIANILAECDDTNYYEPCTRENIITRLRDIDISQTVTDSVRCEPNFACPGLFYDCETKMCMFILSPYL